MLYQRRLAYLNSAGNGVAPYYGEFEYERQMKEVVKGAKVENRHLVVRPSYENGMQHLEDPEWRRLISEHVIPLGHASVPYAGNQ